MDKRGARLRRAAKARATIRALGKDRLVVHRTLKHIYAQVTTADGSRVLATASTLDREIRETIPNGGNAEAARSVGKTIAARALSAGIASVAFDRSGFKYHGRVKALAEAAREAGLVI